MNYKSKLKSYLDQEIKIIESLNLNSINKIINILEETRLNRKKVFICGNGGSAATASHYCSDFNKGVNNAKAIKYDFECLNDNIPTMMAIANDISYDEIFRFSLKNKMKPGDVLIGISCSGNSQNVINAIKYTKSINGIAIAIVGCSGGKLKELADYNIHVDIDNVQISEDIHIIINHLMIYALIH